MTAEQHQLEAGIAAWVKQRAVLGDAVVDAALAGLQARRVLADTGTGWNRYVFVDILSRNANATEACMSATAKVFTSGNSQAVRLPKAFRVEAREMWITRNEHTGEITLKPKPDADALQAFLSELLSHPPSDEFVPARDDAARADPLVGWPR